MDTDVATLLARSRAAHTRFYSQHQVWNALDKTWAHGDVPAALLAMEEARATRLQAEAADPAHLDPAWAVDRVPSAETLAFYDGFLKAH